MRIFGLFLGLAFLVSACEADAPDRRKPTSSGDGTTSVTVSGQAAFGISL